MLTTLPTRKPEQGVTSKCSFGADSVVVGDLGLVYTDCKRAGPVPCESFCSKKTLLPRSWILPYWATSTRLEMACSPYTPAV